MECISTCQEDTEHIGNTIATQYIMSGNIIALTGDIGAGKTTLTKAIGTTLGIQKDMITSPTFSIMNVYPISNPTTDITTLIHIDTYRLNSIDELIDIGIQDYIGKPNTLTIIEWPEQAMPLLQEYHVIHIHIQAIKETTRKIIVTP